MHRILVTGAAGFIASQLAYRLYLKNEDVTLLDNFSYGHEDNLIFEKHDFRKEIIRADIRDKEVLNSLFLEKKFDLVYHFAGITPLPDCQDRPSDAVDVNVRGTTILLELSRKYGVKNFIFASTSAVYENNVDFPSEEDRVEKPSLVYPSTKYMAEQICKSFYDAYHMPITCLRFANVYGPHIDCLRLQPPVMGYIVRELFFDRAVVLHSNGEQERDFIYIDDLIDLAILVQSNKSFDVVNVSSGKTIKINEIAYKICDYMKKNVGSIVYADVSNYWKNFPDLYEGKYSIDVKLMEHEVLKYTCLSNEHAKQKYGWIPKVNLDEGIRRTVDYSVSVLSDYEKSGESG